MYLASTETKYRCVLLQTLFGAAEPASGEDKEVPVPLGSSIGRESSQESLQKKLDQAMMLLSIPDVHSSTFTNLNRRMVQKERELPGNCLPIFKPSMKRCSLFNQLQLKKKRHLVHVDSL